MFKTAQKWETTFGLLCMVFLSSLRAETHKTANGQIDLQRVQQVKLKYSQCEGRFNLTPHVALIAAYCIQPDDVVLDIGAHFGEHAVYYKNLVGQHGVVYCYEASPSVFPRLIESVGRYENIVTRFKAASSSTGKVIPMKFFPSDPEFQCSTIETSFWSFLDSQKAYVDIAMIETEKVDDFLQTVEVPNLHYIKIDVEGHEQSVFCGLRETLIRYRPVVLFEYGFAPGPPYNWEPETIKYMEDLSYICLDVHQGDKRVFPGYECRGGTDLLAIPVEKADEILPILPYLK